MKIVALIIFLFFVSPFIGAQARQEPVTGILLSGKSKDLARHHLNDYQAIRTATEIEMAMSPEGGEYYKGLLYSTIKEKATVGEVNFVLKKINGRISSITDKSPVVTISIPKVSSLEELKKIASELNSSPAFEGSSPVYNVGPN